MITQILKSVHRPAELGALFRLKFNGDSSGNDKRTLDTLAKEEDNITFCYAVLNKVSRSFSSVIGQLPEELKDPVCIFYLVLRALDTIEDDMNLPTSFKANLLVNFHSESLKPNWKLSNIGDHKDYRSLLENYPKVVEVFNTLDQKYQDIIVDISKQMGFGMGKFSKRKVRSIEDYNQYCHYVAGVVGIGLSKLFSASGIESPVVKDKINLANSMGLFLQKTNITRDYKEDLSVSRLFWPEEIWSLYTSDPEILAKHPDSKESLSCLNHLVTDALSHAFDSIEYMELIENEHVFRFCAIPQVMAIATLAELYNNPKVFQRNVKIRRGLAANIMTSTSSIEDVKSWYSYFSDQIYQKLNLEDPNCDQTVKILHRIIIGYKETTFKKSWEKYNTFKAGNIAS